MGKKLLQVFCFLSFIAFNNAAEYDAEQYDQQDIYDVPSMVKSIARNFHNSRHLEQLKQLDDLQFRRSSIKDLKLTPSMDSLNSTCITDILYTIMNLGMYVLENNTKSDWALRMIDSNGKPETGILKGNLRWNGDYDECIGIRSTNPNASLDYGNFQGKYCSVTWTLNTSRAMSLVTGWCVPDSCSAEELKEDVLLLKNLTRFLPIPTKSNFTLNVTDLKCKPTERHLNAGVITIIALLSIFCALSLLGSSITAVKYFKKIIEGKRSPFDAGDIKEKNLIIVEENNMLDKPGVPPDDEHLLQEGEIVTTAGSCLKGLETFLGCFCMFTNGAKLLNTTSSEGELLCIHGIRFLSMSWVILGHTYIFGFTEMRNITDIFTLVNNFPFQAILQAFFSVDSFFVLSGFLLAFLSMKEFSRTKGKINWPYFYVHRYLRLTPMYMIVLGFSATAYLYIGSGPYWPEGDYDVACRKVWWRNLLYINNFDLEAGQCLGHSWYLANDMQFFIISPLFLITLWMWPMIGYLLLAIFLLACCLSNVFITYKFDLPNGIVTFLNTGITDIEGTMAKFTDYFKELYVTPYTRIGPYLVGIIAGYVLFRRKASNAPPHSPVFLILGWIFASAVTLATVYGLYHTNPNLTARCIYNGFSRICFGGGLSWVIYVCLIGQGGFINSLLSFKFFIPLSRLTYAAYLIHPLIISGYFVSLKQSLVFTHPTIVTLFLGFMVVTYALALPVALILESPIVSLEKLVRKKFTKEKKTETVN